MTTDFKAECPACPKCGENGRVRLIVSAALGWYYFCAICGHTWLQDLIRSLAPRTDPPGSRKVGRRTRRNDLAGATLRTCVRRGYETTKLCSLFSHSGRAPSVVWLRRSVFQPQDASDGFAVPSPRLKRFRNVSRPLTRACTTLTDSADAYRR